MNKHPNTIGPYLPPQPEDSLSDLMETRIEEEYERAGATGQALWDEIEQRIIEEMNNG